MGAQPLAGSSWSGRGRRWLPLFCGALAVRLLYWAFVHPGWIPDSDADQYVQLARNLAGGRGFSLQYPQLEVHPTAFRPPLYPALLAPGAWLAGDALWPARLLQAVIGSGTAVLAGVLAARVGGRRAGVIATALVAVYPPLLANDTVTLTEPLGLGLVLAALLLVDDERWVAAGLAGGLLLLTRPNAYLAIAVLAVWAARTIGWRRGLGLAAVAGLVLVPWLVRNQIQVGTWKSTTSDGFTMSAVYGLPAQRVGHFIDPTEAPEYHDDHHILARFDEAEWNDMLMDEAIEAVKANPGYVGDVLWENVGGYFELAPSLNTYPEVSDGRHMGFRRATLPLFWVVTIIGVTGIVTHRRHRLIQVTALLTAQFTVLSLLLVAPPRLRGPFDVMCCIGAGLALSHLWAVVGGRTVVSDVTMVTTEGDSARTMRS